eukprot:6126029-Prymnesium_polylepis.1
MSPAPFTRPCSTTTIHMRGAGGVLVLLGLRTSECDETRCDFEQSQSSYGFTVYRGFVVVDATCRCKTKRKMGRLIFREPCTDDARPVRRDTGCAVHEHTIAITSVATTGTDARVPSIEARVSQRCRITVCPPLPPFPQTMRSQIGTTHGGAASSADDSRLMLRTCGRATRCHANPRRLVSPTAHCPTLFLPVAQTLPSERTTKRVTKRVKRLQHEPLVPVCVAPLPVPIVATGKERTTGREHACVHSSRVALHCCGCLSHCAALLRVPVQELHPLQCEDIRLVAHATLAAIIPPTGPNDPVGREHERSGLPASKLQDAAAQV